MTGRNSLFENKWQKMKKKYLYTILSLFLNLIVKNVVEKQKKKAKWLLIILAIKTDILYNLIVSNLRMKEEKWI